jgi:probable rRNA maturation factor
VDVIIFNEQSILPLDVDSIREVAREVVAFEKQRADEVSVHLVDAEAISQVHCDFFDDPSPTDCISFPIDPPGEPHRVLGEVFVCPEVAIGYATENGLDALSETQLYLVHGLLHLMGYDDISDEDREKMRAAEKRHTDHLKSAAIALRRAPVGEGA